MDRIGNSKAAKQFYICKSLTAMRKPDDVTGAASVLNSVRNFKLMAY